MLKHKNSNSAGPHLCGPALYLSEHLMYQKRGRKNKNILISSGLSPRSVVWFVVPRNGENAHDTKKTTKQRKQSGSESEVSEPEPLSLYEGGI